MSWVLQTNKSKCHGEKINIFPISFQVSCSKLFSCLFPPGRFTLFSSSNILSFFKWLIRCDQPLISLWSPGLLRVKFSTLTHEFWNYNCKHWQQSINSPNNVLCLYSTFRNLGSHFSLFIFVSIKRFIICIDIMYPNRTKSII